MDVQAIHRGPSLSAVVATLEAASLPASDLTASHIEHFFYCGPEAQPSGLVGLQICGADALLRSLVVVADCRSSGLGSALVAQAESHARMLGAQAIYLLTTTAEAFFKRRGYSSIARDDAPAAIRATREFAEICPASSAFLIKRF